MNKQIALLTLMWLFISVPLWGQFYDNYWLMGYFGGTESEPNDSFGISVLNFSDAELSIQADQESNLFMNGASTTMSDYEGNLQLYTNATEVRNHNGYLINNGIITNDSDGNATRLPQIILILPKTDHPTNQLYYYLRMELDEETDRFGRYLKYSIIRKGETDSYGTVVDNNITILTDTITPGKLTATRHGNGRDW